MMIQKFLGTLDERYIICFNLILNTLYTIYKVKDSFTEKEYAAKVFNKYSNSFKKEVEINELITKEKNPSFVKYIDKSVGILNLENNKENKYYILFELPSNGNLLKYLNYFRHPGFCEKICKIIFFKIIKSIQMLHIMDIYHGNIKPENIYFEGENFNIKINDFSHSLLMHNKNGVKILLKKKEEMSEYTAPEIIKGKPFDGEKADIFSLGVLLFLLRTNKFPFIIPGSKNLSFPQQENLYKLIANKKIELFWEMTEKSLGINDFSPEFKKLFIKMVDINPSRRPTIEDIFNEDWMEKDNFLNEEVYKCSELEMIEELRKRMY